MKFEIEIRAAAEKHGISFSLLSAQVAQESSYDPQAVSSCGARGLLQLMPNTGREMGLKENSDFFDPVKNLNAGAAYLLRQYKSVKRIIETLPNKNTAIGKEGMPGANNLCIDDDFWMMALAAYNGGLGYVIAAITLCVAERLSVRWANVSGMLRREKCQVRGKRPDHKQITDYVAKIWCKHKKSASPGTEPASKEEAVEGSAV